MVHVNTKVTGLLMSLKTETGNQNRCLTRDIHHKQRERQIDIRREGAIPVRVLLGTEQAARKEERGGSKGYCSRGCLSRRMEIGVSTLLKAENLFLWTWSGCPRYSEDRAAQLRLAIGPIQP